MGFSGLTFGILDRDGAAWLTTMDTDGHWTDTGLTGHPKRQEYGVLGDLDYYC